MEFQTLTEMLLERGDDGHSVRFIDAEDNEHTLAYAELVRRALSVLGTLQARGMRAGDELIVFTNNNEDFLVAFWGAMLGGIVPVPIAVGISDEHRQKLFRIFRQLERGFVYTDGDLVKRLRILAERQDDEEMLRMLAERTLSSDDIEKDAVGAVHTPTPDDLAFIQYSSGSTSAPKGVCLTHGNVCATLQAIIDGLAMTKADSTFSWMPLTHDMGLIGYHITALYLGIDHTIMETSVFVRRPLLWLQKVSELGSTILCSPNFGYKHFLKVFERKDIGRIDLSQVRLLLNGAEPISVGLCEEFLAAMAPYGLHRTAMLPVYGLAEASLAVTFPALAREYGYICADRHRLRIGDAYVAVDDESPDALKAVKLGRSVKGCEVRIADDGDVELADGHVGHVHIRGTNVTKGLYGGRDDDGDLFTADGWLRTGDCGVIADGELVLTGRQKDIIIVNGQNYYPHDIEEIIADVDGLDLGKVVVCGVQPAASQVEQMLAFILYRKEIESFGDLADKVRNAVGAQTGLSIDHVIPVSRIPKTTSGKVQRAALASDYLNGEFDGILGELTHAVEMVVGEGEHDPIVIQLETICAEFSREHKIGADDNLFEVGISSLTLTEIMLAVDEKYPGRVDINDLFDYPTIRELAQFLRGND